MVTSAGYIKNTTIGNSTVGLESVYRVPLLRDSHLAVAIGKAWDKLTQGTATTASTRIGESFEHIFGWYSDEFLHKEAIFLRLLQALHQLCQDHDIPFVAALLPMNVMVEKEKADLTATYGRSVWSKDMANAESVYYARLTMSMGEFSKTCSRAATTSPFYPIASGCRSQTK